MQDALGAWVGGQEAFITGLARRQQGLLCLYVSAQGADGAWVNQMMNGHHMAPKPATGVVQWQAAYGHSRQRSWSLSPGCRSVPTAYSGPTPLPAPLPPATNNRTVQRHTR